jgi:site-specific DNA-cytosine methylase
MSEIKQTIIYPTVTSVMWHPTPELRNRWKKQYGKDRFTFEEALYAQSFPLWWHFSESKTKKWKWLGEAFPPEVAKHLFNTYLKGNNYVLLDLFAGIGGWSLGAVLSGKFRKIIMVELNREKCIYLDKNFSRFNVDYEILCMDVTNLKDIVADVIVASPPCEDMTILKHFNFNETNVGTVSLTLFTINFVEKVKPVLSFYENVYRVSLVKLLEKFGWKTQRFDMSNIIPQKRVRLLAVKDNSNLQLWLR